MSRKIYLLSFPWPSFTFSPRRTSTWSYSKVYYERIKVPVSSPVFPLLFQWRCYCLLCLTQPTTHLLPRGQTDLPAREVINFINPIGELPSSAYERPNKHFYSHPHFFVEWRNLVMVVFSSLCLNKLLKSISGPTHPTTLRTLDTWRPPLYVMITRRDLCVLQVQQGGGWSWHSEQGKTGHVREIKFWNLFGYSLNIFMGESVMFYVRRKVQELVLKRNSTLLYKNTFLLLLPCSGNRWICNNLILFTWTRVVSELIESSFLAQYQHYYVH